MAARGRGCLGNWGGPGGSPLHPLLSFLLSFHFFLLSTSLLSLSLLSFFLPFPHPQFHPHAPQPLSAQYPPVALAAGLHSITETVLEWK